MTRFCLFLAFGVTLAKGQSFGLMPFHNSGMNYLCSRISSSVC